MRYIKTHKASDSFTELLENRVAQIKHEENYRKDYMTYQLRMMELTREVRNEGIAYGMSQGITQGIAQGAHKKAIETAREMLADNVSLSNIAKYTGLSIEELENMETKP